MTPEQQAVVRAIRKLADFWQIAPEELLSQESGALALPQEPAVMPPKYRHPVSGAIWDGQGGQPQWLREALTREGYTVDELRVVSPSGEPAVDAAD